MPGDAVTIGFVVAGGSAIDFPGGHGNLTLEIGTQLDGRRHVRGRVLFVHGHEDGGERIHESIRVGLFDVRLSVSGNRVGDFLNGRSQEPPGDGDKKGGNEAHEKGGQPSSGSKCFHDRG